MIRVDYEKTRYAAKMLTDATETCKTMTTKAKNLGTSISGCWKGASANAFSSEFSEWLRENNAIQSELKALSSDIKRIANAFIETEKRIADEAAKTTSSGGSEAYGSGGSGGIR